jgi:hypothetical protein
MSIWLSQCEAVTVSKWRNYSDDVVSGNVIGVVCLLSVSIPLFWRYAIIPLSDGIHSIHHSIPFMMTHSDIILLRYNLQPLTLCGISDDVNAVISLLTSCYDDIHSSLFWYLIFIVIHSVDGKRRRWYVRWLQKAWPMPGGICVRRRIFSLSVFNVWSYGGVFSNLSSQRPVINVGGSVAWRKWKPIWRMTLLLFLYSSLSDSDDDMTVEVFGYLLLFLNIDIGYDVMMHSDPLCSVLFSRLCSAFSILIFIIVQRYYSGICIVSSMQWLAAWNGKCNDGRLSAALVRLKCGCRLFSNDCIL